MIKSLQKNKFLWLLVSFLSLIAALVGVFNQDIYSKVVGSNWLPGTISQDVITIIAGLVLFFLSLRINGSGIKRQIVAMSLLAYLFYAYGIYVIERLYNSLYILYMAIFALSFWSIVYGLQSINREVIRKIKVSKSVRYLSAGSLIFIAVLFYLLWIGQLMPLMRTGEKIEFGYSIFILDMAFVLPALIISAILLIKKNVLGVILAPILFIKAFTLLFSVGLGGFVKPFYNQTAATGETAFYIILSVIFLALAGLNLWKIRMPGDDKA